MIRIVFPEQAEVENGAVQAGIHLPQKGDNPVPQAVSRIDSHRIRGIFHIILITL